MIKNRFKTLVVLCLVFTSFVFAKQTISQEAYNKLQKAQKLIEEKKYTGAKTILDEVLKSENKMEKTYAIQTLANIYIKKTDIKKQSPIMSK